VQQGDPVRIGSFVVQGRLGQGAMCAVYLARSPGGRLVAVKVVREELAGDAAFRRRFWREVEAAKKVSGAFTEAVVGPIVALRNLLLALRRRVRLQFTPAGVAVTRGQRTAGVPWVAVTRLRIMGRVQKPWLVAWFDASDNGAVPAPRRRARSAAPAPWRIPDLSRRA
jgi:hypothetical protein